MPHIFLAYLVHHSKLKRMHANKVYSYNNDLDADMALCAFWRSEGDHMYVDNVAEYGFLVNEDDFVVDNRVHPDMWAMFGGNRQVRAK